MFFSALLNKLHNIKASFYDTLEYLKTPFCPVPSALEGLPMAKKSRKTHRQNSNKPQLIIPEKMIDVAIPDISCHQTNRKPAQPGGLVQASKDEDGRPRTVYPSTRSMRSIRLIG